MTKAHLTIEYKAFQDIRKELASEIESLDGTTVSASELARDFDITTTVLRRLVSSRRLRPVRKSRRRNARVRYRLRDVLRALICDGMYATGRVRNGSIR